MRSTSIAFLFLIAGCGSEGGAPPIVSMAAPVIVQASGAIDSGAFAVRVEAGSGTTQLEWPLTELALRVETDALGRAWLRQLALPVGDVAPANPDRAPQNGLVLRELALFTTEPVPCVMEEAERDRLKLTLTTPLSLDWKLQLEDGTLYPLGPLVSEPIALDLTVTRDAGIESVRLEGRCGSDCATIPWIMTVTSASLLAEAPATVTPR